MFPCDSACQNDPGLHWSEKQLKRCIMYARPVDGDVTL